MPLDIHTLGHSNHTAQHLFELLRGAAIQVVADVRTYPTSKHAAYTHIRQLPELLAAEGIGYEFFGDELGGRPKHRSMYLPGGRPNYSEMALIESFGRGFLQLRALAAQKPTALLCAEEDPRRCHRTLLLGPSLRAAGFRLVHIRGDGTTEDETASETTEQHQLALV